MPISPAAIAALCDDLGRWRDRIQSVIGNDSLNWQSFGSEVFDDADGLLARLRMVENAGPLADAIDKEMSDGWHFVTLNIGGNAWKGTDDGKRSVISDLELSREFGENVKRRVAYALAAVEQLRPDTPPNANPTSPQPAIGAAADDNGRARSGRNGKRRGRPNVTEAEAKIRKDWVQRWKRWKAANPKVLNPMERFCKDETAVKRPIDPPTLTRYVNWVTQNRTRKKRKRG